MERTARQQAQRWTTFSGNVATGNTVFRQYRIEYDQGVDAGHVNIPVDPTQPAEAPQSEQESVQWVDAAPTAEELAVARAQLSQSSVLAPRARTPHELMNDVIRGDVPF